MGNIAERAESIFDREKIKREFKERRRTGVSQTDAIAHSACDLAELLEPNAIVTLSTSGQTPRLVSKYRPKAPILCATYSPRTCNQLAVVWGVDAVLREKPASTENAIYGAIGEFHARKRLKLGDVVIVTAGVPAGVPGNTNLIFTEVVKE
jgi:pyruvate kinase